MLAVKTMATRDVAVERFAGRNKSSARQYEPPIGIKARVLTETNVLTLPDGATVQAQYTLVVDGAEPVLPRQDDRIKFTMDGYECAVTVIRRRDGTDLRSTLVDHVILYARED